MSDQLDELIKHIEGFMAGLEWADKRIKELEAAQAWQPIETAPRDGTEILVYKDIATVPVVHIAWYRSEAEWNDEGQYCGSWESLEDWVGWWSYTRTSVSQEKLDDYREPSHWMPLPAPPQDAKP